MKSGDPGPDAAKPVSGSEPEVTPLPAPMPGLSMEMEALEPEEPSLAPLAKLPGVVARAGQGNNKKLKATHSPGGKSSSAKGSGNTDGGGRRKNDAGDGGSAGDRTAGKAKPASAAPTSSTAAPLRVTTKPEVTAPPPPVLAMPETLPLSPPPTATKPSERSRAWWAIGALGLVALGAGVGALLWQPTPQTPVPPSEATPTVAPQPPRTALTVTPLEAAGPGTAPVPVIEALPTPPSPPAAPSGVGTGAVVAAAPNPDATKPAAPDSPGAAPRTTSKPAVAAAPAAPKSTPKSTAPTTSVAAGKPGGDPAGPDGKTPAKAAGKAAGKAAPTVAAAPLSMEPVPQLSPPIIRQHMLSAEKRFPGCVREGYGSNVSIGIVVESSGSVRKADILGPLGQSATGRCISEQIRGLHFPPFTEGGASKFFVWSYQVPQAN